MPFLCVVGGSRTARAAEAARLGAIGASRRAQAPAVRWPFQRDVVPPARATAPDTILIPDLHLAFPIGQTPGTRLILTQSTYQLQRWLDWLTAGAPGATVIAHASRVALERRSPEAFARRGPWHAIELVELDGGGDEPDEEEPDPALQPLLAAFAAAEPSARAAAFAGAAARDPGNPALHLAAASARMELDDLPGAQEALERAVALADDWEAVHFEYGKLWLRGDDLARAAACFATAARLMPTFSAALSNLGAALAETERPAEAVQALDQAFAHDPFSHTILNNISVLCREQGRLDEAVDAARRAIAIAPSFVFGHYNLAHALFLLGHFPDACLAYEEGRRRDPQKNAVQGCRLSVARAATGDYARAVEELGAAADALAADARGPVLEEVEEVLQALAALPGASAAGLQRMLEMARQKKTGS